MIALLCSVPFEAEMLLSIMKKKASRELGAKTVHCGILEGSRVSLCAGGIGKANAAHAATLLITRFNADALVILGIGGAYPSSGARIGDLALAFEEIAGDEGVETSDGFQDMKRIGIPLVQASREPIFNRLPASSPLITRAQGALSSSPGRGVVHTGTFITLSTCTGTLARAKRLEARYNPLCENMEGAAAAQVAVLHGIPWIEVRGISNIVEERDVNKWDIPRAAEAVQTAVQRILAGWNA